MPRRQKWFPNQLPLFPVPKGLIPCHASPSRRRGESLYIFCGDGTVVVTIDDIRGRSVQFHVVAPRSVVLTREELLAETTEDGTDVGQAKQ